MALPKDAEMMTRAITRAIRDAFTVRFSAIEDRLAALESEMAVTRGHSRADSVTVAAEIRERLQTGARA